MCTRSGYCSTMSIATHPAFVIFHYVINGTAAPCPSPRTLLMFICHYRILCHMPLSYRMSYAIILSYLMSHATILSYVTCHYLIVCHMPLSDLMSHAIILSTVLQHHVDHHASHFPSLSLNLGRCWEPRIIITPSMTQKTILPIESPDDVDFVRALGLG